MKQALLFAFLCMMSLTGIVRSVHADDDFEYVVNDERDTVSLVSLRHYGSFNYWREISQANGLGPNSKLKPGQTLKLPRAPILDPREGAGLVVEYWRNRSPGPRARPKPPVQAAPTELPTELSHGPFPPPAAGEDGTVAAPSPSPVPFKLQEFKAGKAVGTDYSAMEPGEAVRPPVKIGPKEAEPRVKEEDL